MALLEVFECQVGRCRNCGAIMGLDLIPVEQQRGCNFTRASEGSHELAVVDMSEIMYDAAPHLHIGMSVEWVASIWGG